MVDSKNIPHLRFPEFNQDWELATIETYFEFKNGLNKEKEFFGKGTPIINFTDVYKLYHIKSEDVKGLVELTSSEVDRFSAKKGDVFFTRTSETIHDIGMSATLCDDVPNCVFSGFTLRARPITNIFVPEFCGYLFNINSVRKEITTKSSMTTRALTSGTLLNKVKFHFPKSKTEQQKIASFLSAVDRRIELLKKKKDLLEDYKKGVIQQLFSQQIRFKDENGNDFPDWEKKKLKNMLIEIVDNRGKTPPIEKTGIPLIEVNAIGGRNISFEKVKKYVSNHTFHNWFRKYLKKDDILFSTVGQTALCSVYDSNMKAAIAQNIVALRFKDVDKVFMFYLLTEKRNNHEFKKIEMGAVQPSVKVSQMIYLQFRLPQNRIEQQKIASFLSAIDSKIETTTQQIEGMQTFKKGLLQQMFV